MVDSPAPVAVLSSLFALLASFAGRSWLHATRARPKVENSIATFNRIIFLPFAFRHALGLSRARQTTAYGVPQRPGQLPRRIRAQRLLDGFNESVSVQPKEVGFSA
jgi:hypothetical protein